MPVRDRSVTLGDMFRVALRFGTTGDAGEDPLSEPPGVGYHPAYDRGPVIGTEPWDRGPADGTIGLDDIFAAAAQFGHSCAEGA